MEEALHVTPDGFGTAQASMVFKWQPNWKDQVVSSQPFLQGDINSSSCGGVAQAF